MNRRYIFGFAVLRAVFASRVRTFFVDGTAVTIRTGLFLADADAERDVPHRVLFLCKKDAELKLEAKQSEREAIVLATAPRQPYRSAMSQRNTPQSTTKSDFSARDDPRPVQTSTTTVYLEGETDSKKSPTRLRSANDTRI